MTCIVGLIDDRGVVWMGGDSAVTTSGWDLRLTRTPKVFRRDVPLATLVGPRTRPMLLGSTGPSRLRQLLSLALEVPEHPAEMAVETYLALPFMDAVRECFKRAGYARRESDQEQHDGMFLVGYAGHLFTVTGDYLAFESAGRYEAIGGGGEIARGAMASIERMEAIEEARQVAPRTRIEVALSAAARHNAGCAAPFHIEHLAPTDGAEHRDTETERMSNKEVAATA